VVTGHRAAPPQDARADRLVGCAAAGTGDTGDGDGERGAGMVSAPPTMARATSSLTEPWRPISQAGTPSISLFEVLE